MVGRQDQGYVVFNEFGALRGPGKELRRIEWTADAPLALSVSPDGGKIAVAGQKEQIRILDLRNRNDDRIVRLPAGWLIDNSPSFTADGKALLATTRRPAYFLTRIEFDGKTAILLDQGRNHFIVNPRLSPNGRYVVWSQKTFDNNFWLLENF